MRERLTPEQITDHVRELLGDKADAGYYSRKRRREERSPMRSSMGWAAEIPAEEPEPETEAQRRLRLLIQRAA
jgi:hypothetical protein